MSEVIELRLGSEEDALATLEKALAGEYEDQLVHLVVDDDWPQLHIYIDGEGYQASLNGRLLKALAEVQGQLNRLYAASLYGKSAKALSQDEREEIELVFSVSPGSSDIKADLAGLVQSWGDAAIDKMTGTEIVILGTVIALVWGAQRMYRVRSDAMQRTLELEHAEKVRKTDRDAEQARLEAVLANAAQQIELVKTIVQDRAQLDHSVLRATHNADSVRVNGEFYSASDIQDAKRTERSSLDLESADGLYVIGGIGVKDAGYQLQLSSVEDGRSFSAELRGNRLSGDEMDGLWHAMRDGRSVDLKVVVKKRDGAVVSANLIGLHRTGATH